MTANPSETGLGAIAVRPDAQIPIPTNKTGINGVLNIATAVFFAMALIFFARGCDSPRPQIDFNAPCRVIGGAR